MAQDAFFLTPDDARRVREAIKAHEHRPRQRADRSRRRRPIERPLIGCVLLADLHTGEEVEVAVLRRERNTELQIVTIVGFHGDYFDKSDPENSEPGSFRLRWSPDDNPNGPDSAPIYWNATAAEVYSALLRIPYFSPDDLRVQLGFPGERDVNIFGDAIGSISNQVGGVISTSHLGRWIVKIGGKWAGAKIPLMRAIEDQDNSLKGHQQAQVTASVILEDSGRTEWVYGFLPIGLPARLGHTPLRRGALCVAGFVPEIGYVPLAVEVRDFWPAAIETPVY